MQFANGKEQRPVRLSSMHKSETYASKSSSGTGSSTYGPRSRNLHQFEDAAGSEDAIKASKPTSPVKSEPDHTLANSYISDWSPLDDDIVLVLPYGSPNNSPSKEEVNAHISGILYGLSTKSRLPAFVELCSEELSL